MSTYVIEPGREYRFAMPMELDVVQVQSESAFSTITTAQLNYYTVDATHSRNTVQWNNRYVTVDTASNTYHFSFRYVDNFETGNFTTWDGTASSNMPFTANFAPLEEEIELGPREFFRFLERLGYDDRYLRLQDARQRELFAREGIVPPWDPEYINRMEEDRLLWQAQIAREKKEEMVKRWGIEELPAITPEFIDQIKANSRKFLEQWLSPTELEMYDKEGHIKVPSTKNSDVIYIVKKGVHTQIEKYENDKLTERLCYVSAWDGVPHDDIIAMKVFDLKYNEDHVLKVANHFPIAQH